MRNRLAFRSYHTVAILAALFIGLIVGLYLHFVYASRVRDPKGVVYYLKPGTSKLTVIQDLADAHLVPHTLLNTVFNAVYSYGQVDGHLKVGEYYFPQGASVHRIWHQLLTGTGLYYRPFLIVPGWTFQQVRTSLNQAPMLQHSTNDWSDAMIMQKLMTQKPEMMTKVENGTLSPEGEFFPETYYYTRGVSDLVILEQAFVLMQRKLQQAWQQRDADLPYATPYDALIAASLIEKEAYLASEQPIIAGVLVNRLNKNMLLQIDPTVIYGLGTRYSGKLHQSDLLIDTPYNTYLHKGLPPTPIAMPGMHAIEAVLHPAHHAYFYYVARGDGSHVFSETLSGQEAAIQRNKEEDLRKQPAHGST